MKASHVVFQHLIHQPSSIRTGQIKVNPSSPSVWLRWLNQLFRRLTVDQPIEITQKYDRAGKEYYQLYDRHSGQTYTFDSREDVLTWLDREYFNS